MTNNTTPKTTNTMSEERIKTEIGIGEKADIPADAEIIDTVNPADAEITNSDSSEEDEVGGRFRRYMNAMCPWCYRVNRVIQETAYRQNFRCWGCSNTFQY